MKRALYKRYDRLADWDLDAGCKNIVNQSTRARRRLKKVLRRQARKQMKGMIV